jgi:hypothetical protein
MESNAQELTIRGKLSPEVFALVNSGEMGIRGATSHILNEAHVSTIFRIYYGTFAVQVARVVRVYRGGPMQNLEAGAIMNLWRVRGLDLMLMVKLLHELFEIPTEGLLDSTGPSVPPAQPES